KFSPSVLNALKSDNIKYRDIEALEIISKKYNIEVPQMIKNVFDALVLHNCEINIEDLEKEIIAFI
ncbi:MAG: threonine synthase, partial [Arcobacter sp.]|nr:threonine synthase [Arcobacter sp.]